MALASRLTTHDSRPTFCIPIVAGIGNALMAEPMVRQLRGAMPDARIVIVALIKPMAAVFQGIDRIETIVTGRGTKNLMKGIRATRACRPDVYLVPFPSNRWQYNVLAAASGAKRVIIHGYPIGTFAALGFLHRHRVPAVRGIHDVVQNLRLLESLNIQPDYTTGPRFVFNDAENATSQYRLLSLWHGRLARDSADQNTGEAPVPQENKSFVIMHAGSAKTILAEAKRWPSENYAEVASAIAAELKLDVVIVEGPDEAGVSDEILQYCKDRDRIHTLKLNGPLGESAATLSQASFYVGTDSGLAHLSAAVGVPPITLFAPADPDRVCPFGYRDWVVQPDDGRQSTFLYPWRATKPKLPREEIGRIQRITVDQVMQKVRQLYARPPTDYAPTRP